MNRAPSPGPGPRAPAEAGQWKTRSGWMDRAQSFFWMVIHMSESTSIMSDTIQSATDIMERPDTGGDWCKHAKEVAALMLEGNDERAQALAVQYYRGPGSEPYEAKQ